MNDDDEGFDEPYLPARYREHIRKKKQRRLLKKLGAIGLISLVLVGVFLVFSGLFTGVPRQSLQPPPIATVTTGPSVSPSSTVPAPDTTAQVPSPARTIQTATATPNNTTEPILTARAAAVTSVTTTRMPRISESQARIIARTAFPGLPAGEIKTQLSTSTDFGQVWKFTLQADTRTEASGLIDAETGSLVLFNRTVSPAGRPENPVLTLEKAQKIADSTISNRNNVILSINMSSAQYIPLSGSAGKAAGYYRFTYTRMVQGYPCDADGFIVAVDAITGEITEYVQHWQTLDNAFMLAEDPVVPRFDATYAVSARAKSIYPSSITGLRIISADVRWKDRHDPETTPRPATIPLAWKVVFDDETIRAKTDPMPAVGWVDTQTGGILELDYQH
jgi:hypothetical protein